jgi:hypothetical protein
MSEIVSKEDIEDAGHKLGINMENIPIKQRMMLTVVYFYNEGWIGEAKLEKLMTKIVRWKKL